MIYAVVDQFESVVYSWLVVRSSQALLDYEFLVVRDKLFVGIVGNFNLIAKLEYLETLIASIKERLILGILPIEHSDVLNI